MIFSVIKIKLIVFLELLEKFTSSRFWKYNLAFFLTLTIFIFSATNYHFFKEKKNHFEIVHMAFEKQFAKPLTPQQYDPVSNIAKWAFNIFKITYTVLPIGIFSAIEFGVVVILACLLGFIYEKKNEFLILFILLIFALGNIVFDITRSISYVYPAL